MMNKDFAGEMLTTMIKIRLFEEKAVELFAAKELPGWLHSYIGEEAVATGVCLALNPGDYISSTHRGHGHCIAKGVSLKAMMAELYGKKTGYCHGRGGSMHIADFSKGMIGANGIVGGGIPVATGAALGSKMKKMGKVSVCFFGDGASNQGAFHEALNLAAVWNLPAVYVCENNLFAETTPQSEHQHINDIAQRAVAYGMFGDIADGMNVLSVYEKAKLAADRARNGEGPTLLECKTYRYRGHWEGDPQPYRTKKEIEEWKKKDPIRAFQQYVIENRLLTESEIEKATHDIQAEIDEAVVYGRKSPLADVQEAVCSLFV
ncbi:MAG: thiamine pyrophosphate-dependent dehydrogenase E1 component subunit alpha [Candidatus Atribacteria bacterium]|nr:thiamine pyrophosphate-dependent dehydrogenase E1 component subunit alpha [Candidatus Atribacteria bacterium]